MKADRLVAMLLLLQSAPRRTARELAGRLEVSQRTIYRDVDALAAAGIPVYADRGADGGIALSDGYRRALVHLGEDEVRALFVPGSAILSDLGLGSSAQMALEKLRGGFSALQQRAIEGVRSRVHIDQRRWHQSDAPVATLSVLRRALWDDRCVEIVYLDRKRARSTRRVDPLGLVSKAGVWYVIARGTQGTRSYRVDRIEAVEELDERFVRPLDFDLDAYWRETSAAFMQSGPPDLRVVLLMEREAVATIDGFFPVQMLDENDPQRVEVRFPSRESAVNWLTAWGTSLHIVEPPDVREEVVERARRIIAHHLARAALEQHAPEVTE